jgi:hypothetical protein
MIVVVGREQDAAVYRVVIHRTEGLDRLSATGTAPWRKERLFPIGTGVDKTGPGLDHLESGLMEKGLTTNLAPARRAVLFQFMILTPATWAEIDFLAPDFGQCPVIPGGGKFITVFLQE